MGKGGRLLPSVAVVAETNVRVEMGQRSVFIGYDPKEQAAYAVAQRSARTHGPSMVPIQPIMLNEVIEAGLYKRKTFNKKGKLWDAISEAPMSTEFAISRFLTIELTRRRSLEQGGRRKYHGLGWALFMDCDVMVRRHLGQLFHLAENEPDKALFCVQHQHNPPPGLKMDGQEQVRYARKNWSSVMLFNCDHEANDELTLEMINSVPGRDLHRFCWLKDEQIGELSIEWNWLVGHSPTDTDPAIVHWTEGGPWLAKYKDAPYSNEWLSTLVYG